MKKKVKTKAKPVKPTQKPTVKTTTFFPTTTKRTTTTTPAGLYKKQVYNSDWWKGHCDDVVIKIQHKPGKDFFMKEKYPNLKENGAYYRVSLRSF